MAITSIKILISDAYNPISGSIKNLINEMDTKVKLTEKENCADIILSLAYHDEYDIAEMKTMSRMTKEFPNKKIIFLSWFHHIDDSDKYQHFFNPRNPACILMDANKYRILQLPVNKEMLISNISELTSFF